MHLIQSERTWDMRSERLPPSACTQYTPDKKATSSKSGSVISIRSRRQIFDPPWPPPTIDTLTGPLRWLPANIRVLRWEEPSSLQLQFTQYRPLFNKKNRKQWLGCVLLAFATYRVLHVNNVPIYAVAARFSISFIPASIDQQELHKQYCFFVIRSLHF